jgi:2-iminoacetate synthase
MSFRKIYDQLNWEEVKKSILDKSRDDVERALLADRRSVEDFKALISPAATYYLEEMAQLSNQITQRRFGKTIQLFVPMYLSNECTNICTYCGFSFDNKIKRKTLNDTEILKEVAEIKRNAFDHILLVTGEANHTVNVGYLINAIKLIQSHFSNISIEVQPLEQNEYEMLQRAGVHGVLMYQETYNRESYSRYHTKGKKANFYNRLDTSEKIGSADMHKIGLGVLLGLDDWRVDSFCCALHLNFLQKKFWQTKFSVSFPRIRPAEGIVVPEVGISDRELVQLICAYRLFNEDVELSISTRESEKFRDNVMKLGITSMSAGSKTNPGGYSVDPESLDQFEIFDSRTASQVASIISGNGYEPVWKDWDRSFQKEI